MSDPKYAQLLEMIDRYDVEWPAAKPAALEPSAVEAPVSKRQRREPSPPPVPQTNVLVELQAQILELQAQLSECMERLDELEQRPEVPEGDARCVVCHVGLPANRRTHFRRVSHLQLVAQLQVYCTGECRQRPGTAGKMRAKRYAAFDQQLHMNTRQDPLCAFCGCAVIVDE